MVEGWSKKGKRIHRHRQQVDDLFGEGSIRGLNGKGKNIIKIIYLKKI